MNRCKGKVQRVLFIQATEPGAYPPLMNASALLADAGWEVTFLSAPITGNRLEMAPHPAITIRAIRSRPSHVMRKASYARYVAAATRLALRLRPAVVYASDPLGAAPGRLAARLAGARLVYHEHDTPAPGTLRPWVARQRAAAARRAHLVVFPNEVRARMAQRELGFGDDRLRIVWNCPRVAELPSLTRQEEGPLLLYYHGSITPHRLPETVVEAVRRFSGRVLLRIAGYEAPGAPGYVTRLLDLGAMAEGENLVKYVGQVPSYRNLLADATSAHIGLALMPMHSDEVNLTNMTGASNKAFDYMAAGLALLVSDLPDWRDMFVAPGYGRACDPADPTSIAAALTRFLDHPEELRAMAARGRAKIEAEWNYDSAFNPVLATLLSLGASPAI